MGRHHLRLLTVLLATLALIAAACGGGSSDDGDDGTTATTAASAGDAANGESLYAATCSGCHGADASGIEGLGRPLAASDFVGGMSDGDLVAFIAEGRSADHPDNEAGVAMPPRGGNPALSDSDLLDIVAFLRTLQ